jgi:hypothetical protein
MKTLGVVLTLIISSFAFADEELSFQRWQELNIVAQSQARDTGILPPTMSPVSSKEGVFQQIMNYNLNEFKKYNQITARVMDTQWGTSPSGNGVAAKPKVDAQKTSFQMKPFETKAWIDFGNKWKASYNYQIWSGSSEFLFGPKQKLFGCTFGYSYVITSDDSQNKFSIAYSW